jgi:hypothetical protein
MQTHRTFEDVVIIHQGSVGNFSFLPGFKHAVQTVIRTDILQFMHNKRFRRKGRTFINISEKDRWTNMDCLYSTQPLTKNITYFQVKITKLKKEAGIIVGVQEPWNEAKLLLPLTVKMCNASNEVGNNTLNLHNSCVAVQGDVLGVVVDKGNKIVKFFVNGTFVADGEIPDDLTVMYAVINMYYRGSSVAIGDYIPYHTLKM